MNLTTLIAYLFLALTVLSAMVVVLTRNVLYAAFSLMVTFLGVAALYVFAGAEFLAITQVLVYVGGILVLLIFGVMLTNRIAGQAVHTGSHNVGWGILISFAFLGLVSYGIFTAEWPNNPPPLTETDSTIRPLGIGLMSEYIVPFELTGVLLLVALIGAAYVAQRQMD